MRVGRAELTRMIAAAEAIRDCRRELGSAEAAILAEILGGAAAGLAPAAPWRHYPEGEGYDPVSQTQFFYHAHDADEQQRKGEHGHFHVFLRAGGMPSGIAPLLLPENAIGRAATPPQAAPLRRGNRDALSHIVAIALDPGGAPVRLFTTNRWVTGETWYRGEDVIRMLDRFAPGPAQGVPPLTRWLAAVVTLFAPEIAALLRARDESIVAWRRRRRGEALEDPRLEVTSSRAIDLEARLALIDRLSSEPAGFAGPAPPARGGARLPRMAEGWGEP